MGPRPDRAARAAYLPRVRNRLADCVYTIREHAIINLQKLIDVFGVEWARSRLIPELLSASSTHTNYLYRMTALSAAVLLADTVGADTFLELLLPMVLRMRNDPVSASNPQPPPRLPLSPASRLIHRSRLQPAEEHGRVPRRSQVPNIRFNVAKTLQALLPTLDVAVTQEQVKPCLLALSEDADKDVRYFAAQALQAC